MSEDKKEGAKTFTKKKVAALLQEQVKRCASAIDGDNLS